MSLHSIVGEWGSPRNAQVDSKGIPRRLLSCNMNMKCIMFMIFDVALI